MKTWAEEDKAIIRNNMTLSAGELQEKFFSGRKGLSAIDNVLWRERHKAGYKPPVRTRGGNKARKHIGGNTAGIVDYDIRGSYDGF